MKPFVCVALLLSLRGTLPAQEDIPLLLPEERKTVEIQTREFNQAITPALGEAAKSTVRIWAGSGRSARRLAYGTVIGDGSRVITKWSEIVRGSEDLHVNDAGNGRRAVSDDLRIDGADFESRAVTLAGVYEGEDLVVLNVQGGPLTPVKWSTEKPKLGAFLAAPQPDGRIASFGIVSVLERNLRDADLAFLGIGAEQHYQGPGVKIQMVESKSGAELAGLQPGDVILKIGERSISGLLALKNALSGTSPGQKISLLVESSGKQNKVDVLLGTRTAEMKQMSGERLQMMERMGGSISQVRDGFTHVIQTDMRPAVNQIGGPVVDLKGNVIGITMARADRTRSFIMPSAAVTDLLKKDAADPALAQVRGQEADDEKAVASEGPPRQRPRVIPRDRMERHLADMRRLMEYMQDEMDGVEDR